jgi:hypothetical protein
VTKFGEQEDSVDKMHDQIMNLTNEEAGLRTSLDEYLMSLDV